VRDSAVTMRVLRGFTGLAGLILIWAAVVWSGTVPANYFPSPLVVAEAFVAQVQSGEILRATAATFGRALAGLVAATLLGILIAVLAVRYRVFGRAFVPIADLFRSLPPAAITPVSIFFLGLGFKLYAFIIVFACFWSVFLAAHAALAGVSRQLHATARAFGYEGWARLIHVELPAALPETFIGIRIAAAVSLIAAIVAEMLAGRDGLGHLMSDAAFSLRIPDTFVGFAATMACGVVMNQLVVTLRRRAIGWHVTMTEANTR
jgi:ABC-type nitrate/sulfonate/bicarbonate transport system permease component